MKEQDIGTMNLTQKEMSRYARHLSLPELGLNGQKRLKKASVLCVGTGGLGSPLLLYLAASGVGRIGIVDFDVVEESNLQRQVIHGISNVGQPKIDSARTRIMEINPYCNVETFETKLSNSNALKILSQYDIICDCTDNFPSRYLINDACLILGKPNVYGSIQRFEGQASVFNLDKNSPNYRDLVPTPPPPGLIPSCQEGGVIGVLPGLIGLIQATETIKIITGIGAPLNGRVLVINALEMTFKELTLRPSSKKIVVDELMDYQEFCGVNKNNSFEQEVSTIKNISVQNLKKMLESEAKDFLLIDVRNKDEAEISSIASAKLIPLSSITSGEAIDLIKKLAPNQSVYVYCQTGIRSAKAVFALQQHGINGINVTGGIQAWSKEISSRLSNESKLRQ